MKNIGTLFFLLFVVGTTFAQKQQHKVYSPKDFLGEKKFIEASQDKSLNIYFRSDKDVLKFNGTEFSKIYLDQNVNAINKLFAYEEKLFYSTQNETFAFDLKKDSSYVVWDHSAIDFQIFDEVLWMISKNQLVSISPNSQKVEAVYSSASKEKFLSFIVNPLHTIIGHNKGLTVLNGDASIENIGTFLSQPSKIISIDSSTYILNRTGLFSYSAGVISRLFENDVEIKDFFIDDFGKTWIVDLNGRTWINDGLEKESLKSVTGEEDIKIEQLFTDKENNIWLLGANKIVKVVQNNPFSTLRHENISNVFSGEKGNLLVGEKELIHYNFYNKKTITKIPEAALPIENAFAFEKDNDWILTSNNQTYLWDIKENQLNLVEKNSQYIPFKYLSKDSILAISRNNGIYYLNNDYLPYQELTRFKTSSSIEIIQNKIISRKNEGEVSIFDLDTKKLINFTIADTINFENLVVGSSGFWYFGKDQIFFITNTGEVQELKTSQFDVLEDAIILNLFDDHTGNLWVSTKDYLLRLPYVAGADKMEIRGVVKYTPDDFLVSTYFKYAKKGSSDLLWFVNPVGITIFDPLKEIPNLTPPGITIKKAFSYSLDEFNNPKDTVNLMTAKQTIDKDAIVVIEAFVINHLNNDKSQIIYKNISLNQSERRVNSGEKIILTDFEDGLNSISLGAINKDGVESRNQKIVNMTVNPPIWKKNWFYLSGALSLLLLGFIGYRTVIGIKNSRAKELEDELNKGLEDLEKKSHLQVLKAERLKQLNDLITSQKGELEKKNAQIESQKYELSLTNQQIKKQKDLLEETSSKLKSSINYAKRIQNALMSTEVEIKESFKDSFVYFLPRDLVSGDFFWFNKVLNEKNEEIHILAAVDCTGHGVPGAIVSVVGMNLLNNITRQKKIYDPGQILTEMNADIIADLRQDETQVNDGMDMTLVSFNTVTNQLLFAGAKNPLMYVEDGELIRIKGDKYAIGGQQRGADREFQTHHLDLTDGKKRTFYLFSDGYQDQFGGEKGFKYLTGNFKKLLLSIHDKDVLEQKTILHEEIEDWKEGYNQTDDILVIGFKI